MITRPSSRRFLVATATAIVALLAIAPAAQAERDLEQRFSANQRGNITMAANSLVTCSLVVSNCQPRRDRGPVNLNNGAIQMQYNDVDGDPATKSSASAMLNLPAGAEVLFAGLYWGGRPELQPTGSEFNVTPAEFGEVKLAVPGGGGYQQITADALDQVVFGGNGNQTWQGFADVTSQVRAAGAGEYTVADVRLEAERVTTNGPWGGWALVVAYSDPAQPWRNLVVYDGLKAQDSGGSPTNVAIEGFRTPPAPATVNSTVGVIAYEGDPSTVGDSAGFVQGGVEVALQDALNPANNFFNARISREGVEATDRNPNYSNNYAFDAKLIKTTNVLQNSTTDATLRFKTLGDGYATGAVSVATELFTPKVTLSKSVENVTDPGAPFAHPGDVLEYEITAQNQTSTPADPVDGASSFVIGDAIPPGLTYVPGSLAISAGPGAPATPTDAVGDDLGEYDAGGDEVRFRVGTGAGPAAGGTLDPGASTTVRFRAVIDLSFPGGEIANEAVADYKAATLDIPLQDSAEASLLSEPLADLTLEKSVSPELVSAVPTQVTYSLEVENKGPGTSAATVVTDELPAGLEYVSDDAGCDTSALPIVECDLGAMLAGASETIQLVAEVPTTTTGAVVKNTAKVQGATPDLEPADNEDTATLEIEPLSDLAITKTTTASSVRPGQLLTYLLKVENKGPTDDSLVTITDTLPPQLTYVGNDSGCNVSALPTITCTFASLGDGVSATVAIVAEVKAGAGATIDNTAEVSGTNPDPVPENDESTATTPVEAISDLAIDKSVSAASAKPGEQLTYTLEVENKGPSTSSPTTVTDTLPAGLVYVSDDAGCETTGLPEVICNAGSLASGASRTIELVAEVAPGATGTLENSAEVTGPNVDPEPADNEDSAATAILPLASDLVLSKSAPGAPVKAGDEIPYTLVASNLGPDPSPATVLTDTLPPQLAYVSDDAGCDTSALPEIKCDLGTLPESGAKTVHIVTKVIAHDGQPIQNQARVSGANPDPEPGNNPDAAQTPVLPPAGQPQPPAGSADPPAPRPGKAPKGAPRLTVQKRASSAKARPGSVIAYRIVVRNEGTAPARKVEVCDHPPAAQRTLRTEPRATSKTEPCWSLPKLPAGAKRTFTLTAMVESSATATQRNTVTVAAANANRVQRDAATVRVKPLPSTGCLIGAAGSNSLADIRFLC